MIPKVLVPAKAIKRFRAKVREMLAPSTTKESTRCLFRKSLPSLFSGQG
jgi:hypothetical protein